MVLFNMPMLPTPFLTHGVAELFRVTSQDAAEAPAEPLLDASGRIDWERGPLAWRRVSAGELEPGTAHTELTPMQVSRCVGRLRRLALRAPAALKQLVVSELPSRLSYAHALLVAAEADASADSSAGLSALQLVLAELEARVCALYSAVGDGPMDSLVESSFSHAKLKDMLRAPHVMAALGAGMSLVLFCLAGPLHGVCLRNLAWHGFLCPADLPGCAPWPSLLLVLVACGLPPVFAEMAAPAAGVVGGLAVVGSVTGAAASTTDGCHASHRTGARAGAALRLRAAAISQAPELNSTSTTLAELAEALPATALACAPFLHPLLVPALADGLRLAQTGKSVRALGLLFAVIESCLRAAYVAVNELEAQNGQAQLFVRHLLLEQILSAAPPPVALQAQRPAGGSGNGGHGANRLLSVLGEGALAALYDEFIWLPDEQLPIKPRPTTPARQTQPDQPQQQRPHATQVRTAPPQPLLRNLLVHGGLSEDEEVPPDAAPRIACLTVGLAVLLAQGAQRGWRGATAGTPFSDAALPLAAAACARAVADYVPLRHPLQRVSHKLRALLTPPEASPSADEPAQALVHCVLSPSLVGCVGYCARCRLPPDLCAFGPAPERCMLCALGVREDESCVASLGAAARRLRAALESAPRERHSTRAQPSTQTSASDREPLEAAQPSEAEAALLEQLRSAIRALSAHASLTAAHASGARAGVLRRWCDEGELGKLAVINDTLCACLRIADACRTRIASLAVEMEVALLGASEAVARKRVAAIVAAHLVELVLLTVEVGTLALAERAGCDDASQALPTHFFQFFGSLCTTVEHGQWKTSAPFAAALVGSRPGESVPAWRTSLLAKMPPRDREKHDFMMAAYLDKLERGEPLDARLLSRAPVVVNIALAEERAQNEPGYGRYRLQREKLRERRRVGSAVMF